jgi:hypothetical protein
MLETLREELKQAGGKRLAVVALAGLAFAVYVARSDWPFYRKMHEQGRPVDGRVVLKGLGAADAISYAFDVQGRTYEGVGKPGYGNKDFADLNPGDHVLVFYIPQDPSVHCLGDPVEHLRDQNRAILTPLVLLCGVLFWALSRELKRAGP